MADAESMRRLIEQFTPLTEDEWQMMQSLLSERTIRRHECMIREGMMGRELGYILEGEMRHYYTQAEEQRTTYFYFENAFVGPYMSCVTGQPSRLTIEALSDTRLLVFPYEGFKALFQRSHTWERFGRKLAEYLAIGLEDRMVGLLTLSPEERYKDLLGSNKRKILERIPQQHIANYLGITPVSLSRIRKRLTDQ
ncbi:MAG: Crp/Fnr family transcriptional regulator [Bacteroidetes bacterium]|nr:Crp/Fnr family transcriptional regulator [Bacteroidota bacterium]